MATCHALQNTSAKPKQNTPNMKMGTQKAGKANIQNPPPQYPARLDLRQLEAIQRLLEGRPTHHGGEAVFRSCGFTVSRPRTFSCFHL